MKYMGLKIFILKPIIVKSIETAFKESILLRNIGKTMGSAASFPVDKVPDRNCISV